MSKKSIYITLNDISKIGGLSRVALQLYGLWKEQGYEVKIVTGHLDSQTHQYWSHAKEDIIDLGLGSVHKIRGRIARALWYWRYMKKLRSLPLSQNSVVVSIETLINFATFFALKTKARLIATEHTSFERSFITQFLKKFIYPKFDQLVVLTQEDARKYRKFCANVTVIPNFVPIPQKRSISKKRILFVGNIEPVKGVEFLEQIIKNFPLKEWEFCIVGNGSKLQWLQDHLRGYNVRFAGALSDVVPYYLKSAIFILTSKKEGFPMVLLEAKSFGLPIVSFDIPTGPKEIVRNGVDGFLVPLGDIQGFVRRLEILAQDDTLREAFSQAAREDIERFSPEKIGALWQKILF